MVPTKSFSYGKALNFGWNNYTKHFSTFIIASLLMCIIHLGFMLGTMLIVVTLSGQVVPLTPYGYWHALKLISPAHMVKVFSPSFQYWTLALVMTFLSFCFFVLMQFYHYQMLRFGCLIYEEKQIHWKDFFTLEPQLFFSFIGTQLLFWLRVIIGLILLIWPGIYKAVEFYFAGFPVVDGKAHTISEDTTIARALSKDIKGRLVWFGFLLFIFGSIITKSIILFPLLPIVFLAQVHAYKQLLKQL